MEERPLNRREENETAIPPPLKPVFVEVSGRELEKRAAQVGALAGQTVALLRQAPEHAEKWRQAALERTSQLRRQARGRYEETRSRAQRVARDYPLHVVLAAGVAGFLLGAALRTWRAHRA